MSFLKGCANLINFLNEKIGKAVSWLTFVLVLIVCYDVLSRYLFETSVVAVQELQWHIFSIIFLIAAAYSLKHNKHVRVDILYTRFSKKSRAWIDLFGSLIFLIPFCALVIWSSQNFVESSFKFAETSPDPGGLPARYILKACIPLGFFLLLIQGFSLAFQSLITVFEENEESNQ